MVFAELHARIEPHGMLLDDAPLEDLVPQGGVVEVGRPMRHERGISLARDKADRRAVLV